MASLSRPPDTDAGAIAGLWPDLVRLARGELFTRQLDPQLAEDFVSGATLRWLSARIQYRSPRQTKAWFRTTVRRMAVDHVRRPGSDILNQPGVFSLSEDWARGDAD